MKNIIISIALVLGLAQSLSGQSIERSVIGAAGGYAETVGISGSSTVGEIATTTASNGGIILTQGFQQPVEGDFTSIRQPDVQIGYRIFPNPTTDRLNIELSSSENLDIEMSLVDMQGRAVGGLQESFLLVGSVQRQWDLSSLSEGTYVLRFYESDGSMMQAIRIQKSH